MIEISNLTKTFSDCVVLNNLSLVVKRGEVLGFLGPNGAGKSTTMRILTGFVSANKGTIKVNGQDFESNSVDVKKTIGYLPEGAPSYGDMTVISFMKFIGEIRGYAGSQLTERINHVLGLLDLQGVSSQVIETLSKGYKRRVGLAQAIIHDPQILLLDEPTDGLDPNQKQQVRALIKNLSKDKIVIVSTHILEEVTSVCTRAVIISQGEIVADGTPAELETKSRYHNAVTIQLLKPYDISEDLCELKVEFCIEKIENPLGYCVVSGKGEPLFASISAIAHRKKWPIKELFATRGQLEDVFFRLTQGVQV
jgi:ABC-2 type transport system ATP-binding protein